MFGFKRHEVTGGWGISCNEELHSFTLARRYYNDPVNEDEIERTCSTHGAKRSAYKVSVRKPEEIIPLRVPGSGW
jgi:hypothetical protein